MRKIYPIYGAKNLSALVNGLLHFFAFSENPAGIDIRRLLQDAVAGRVYAANPEILRRDSLRTDFMEFISETYEDTMLSQLCRDFDFLAKNPMLCRNIQHGLAEGYDRIITDSELQYLFECWRDVMVESGKYRAAYKEYNSERRAREIAKTEEY